MTVLLAVGVMVLSAAFLGLRVLFGKDEEVRRPGCSNANAFMDDQEACPSAASAGVPGTARQPPSAPRRN